MTDFAKGAGGKAETEIQHGKNAVDAAQQASMTATVIFAPDCCMCLRGKSVAAHSSWRFAHRSQCVQDVMHVQASVKHLVWSALEDPRPIIKGALPESAPGRVLSHFESKSDITVSIFSFSALMLSCLVFMSSTHLAYLSSTWPILSSTRSVI